MPNKFGGRENLDAIEFIRELNALTHGEHAGSITVAEESTAFPSRHAGRRYLGGLGFTYKWNMGWMNDTLEYIKQDPIFRRYHQRLLTFSLLYAFSENYILPFSHDEVVHMKGSMWGKVPGDDWQKAATLRALYGYMYAHPGKKLMFMGMEFGQAREWSHDRSLDWHLLEQPLHAGCAASCCDLNRVYTSEPALYQCDFEPHGLPVDRLQRQRQLGRVADPPRRRPGRLPRRRAELHAAAARRLRHRRAARRAATPSCSTATPRSTAAATSATAASCSPSRSPSHGHAQSLRLSLPPLGFLLLKPSPGSPWNARGSVTISGHGRNHVAVHGQGWP